MPPVLEYTLSHLFQLERKELFEPDDPGVMRLSSFLGASSRYDFLVVMGKDGFHFGAISDFLKEPALRKTPSATPDQPQNYPFLTFIPCKGLFSLFLSVDETLIFAVARSADGTTPISIFSPASCSSGSANPLASSSSLEGVIQTIAFRGKDVVYLTKERATILQVEKKQSVIQFDSSSIFIERDAESPFSCGTYDPKGHALCHLHLIDCWESGTKRRRHACWWL